LDLDEKEVDNVIKVVKKVNKHTKLRAKNAFDEWRIFCGFDTIRLIVDLLEDESFVKNLMDMLSSFVLQVAKKDGNMYPLTR